MLTTLLTALLTFCTPPPILRTGVAPHTTLTYRFYGAWHESERRCVRMGLAQWEHAAQSTLDVHFVATTRTEEHPRLTLTKTRLPFPIGGAVVGLSFNADRYLTGGGIVYTDDLTRLSTCDGFTKITLHEVGHLMGLGHVEPDGHSIMQPFMHGHDDEGNTLPHDPTQCDVQQARVAAGLLAD